MANANAQIANVNANNYNNNTLPSAVAMHHHEHHHGLEPNFEFDIVGQADNVNGLDALEAAHQVYGGELGMVYDMNVQVVQGPHSSLRGRNVAYTGLSLKTIRQSYVCWYAF